jgi:uncharacterized protein YceK
MKMRGKNLFILSIAFPVFSQGCFSVACVRDDPTQIYGGTREIVMTWGGCIDSILTGTGGGIHGGPGAILGGTFAFFDFPFTLTLDTILLPITICRHVSKPEATGRKESAERLQSP